MIKYQYVMQYYVHVHVCTGLDKAVQTDPHANQIILRNPPPPTECYLDPHIYI